MEINAAKGNKKVTLTIVDHGVGMRPEDKMKIFKKELITTRGTSEETGTGIGLMICKSLIEKSDCELSFTSELGKGTTFTILLPQSE